MERKVVFKASQLNTQGLANIAWSYAILRANDVLLFRQVAIEASGKICHFKPQEVSNIVWAFAEANSWNPVLFAAVGRDMAYYTMQDFEPQHLANLLWSLAACTARGSVLHCHIMEACMSSAVAFEPQGFANVAWASATLALGGRVQ